MYVFVCACVCVLHTLFQDSHNSHTCNINSHNERKFPILSGGDQSSFEVTKSQKP